MASTVASLVSPEKEQEFLDHLRENGNITVSARLVGHDRRTFYRHKKSNSEFAAAWDAAIEEAADVLEEEVRRRGQQGYLEPVFWQGQQTGVVRKYSDTLLIFLMKKRNPDFRDNTNINLNGKTEIRVITGLESEMSHGND